VTAQAGHDRPLSGGVRGLLTAFAVLTLLATSQLYVRAEQTAQGFAWTIEPPLTAAFFGAGYTAGFVLVVLSLRQGTWAAARVGYLTVLLFVVLALAATLLHLDRFHFDAPGALARAAAWTWLVVYLVVPVAMALALPDQLRAPGADRPSGVRLGRPLRAALVVQAVVLVVAGVLLFLVDGSRSLWPWALTELTARAVASWLVALGVGAALAVVQDDLVQLRPAAVTGVVLGVLQLAALLRFSGDVDWGRPAAVAYVLAVVGVLAVGAAGLVRAGRRGPPAGERASRPAAGRAR
jgi:hypothetical protein